jgi:Ca-activated chloride channel family protein
VTFAASSQVVQAATREKEPLIAAINRLQMQVGTAIGSGIVVCLAELFPEQGLNLEELTFGVKPGGSSLDAAGKPPTPPFTPVAPGSYKSAAIILLSDGRRTTGVDYAEGGMPIYMRLDEPTLQEIARITGGEYYYAGTAEKLRSVYQNLGSKLQVQTRETELSGPLALLAALLALAAALLSVLWFRRIT